MALPAEQSLSSFRGATMNRRDFLMSTAVLAGGAAVRGLASPNDTVRMAVVGCGGRGRQPRQRVAEHAERRDRRALRRRRVAHRGEAEDAGRRKGMKKPATYVDFRKLLEDKIDRRRLDRDAESLAHAADDLGVPGRQGRLRREAVLAQHLRVAADRRRRAQVQPHRPAGQPEPLVTGAAGGRRADARRRARRGLHGARPLLQVARHDRQDAGLGGPRRASTTTCGPGPRRSARSPRTASTTTGTGIWDTGNGDLGNQGIHEVDIARWGLGVTHPTKVSAIGGKFMFDDDQETPNTISAAYEFDVDGKKKMMTFEVRHWISPHEAGHQRRQARATPSAISSTARRATWSSTTTTSTTPSWARIRQPGPARRQRDEHWANFIAAVRSRKREDLNAEIEEGALSCNLMHLANISYRRRTHAPLGCEDDDVRRRCRGQQDADARVSGAVRRAKERVGGHMGSDHNEDSGMSRRDFATRLGAAAAGIAVGGDLFGGRLQAAPAVSRRILGANDRVVVASIGIRGQGNALKRGFAKLENVEIKTLCDIDANLAPRADQRRPR